MFFYDFYVFLVYGYSLCFKVRVDKRGNRQFCGNGFADQKKIIVIFDQK